MPKVHAMSDIYCQLIPNEDDNQSNYEIVPRIGAFEVSVNGVLLFSKCLSGCWPHYKAMGERAYNVAHAIDNNEDISSFQTTGTVKKSKSRREPPPQAQPEPAPV